MSEASYTERRQIHVDPALFLAQWKKSNPSKRIPENTTRENTYNENCHLDKLTGILNSNCIREILETRPESSGLDITVFSLDVDDLKKVNDSLGHLQGDELLARVGQVLTKTFRQGDSLIAQLNSGQEKFNNLLGRNGGDEFVAILVTDPQQTQEALEKITQRLSDNIKDSNNLEGNTHKTKISLSYGHSQYDPESDENLFSAYKRADDLMYSQKKAKKAPVSNTPKLSRMTSFQIN